MPTHTKRVFANVRSMQALTKYLIRNSNFWETKRPESTVDLTGCVHSPPSGSMWLDGVWLDRGVRIVGGAAVRMRSHQDSRRQAFTACLRFVARESIFASLPLRFTTYHFVPLFACLCVADAGGACYTTRSRARAARAAGARDVVSVRGGTFRLRFLVVGSSHLFVCCWLCLCVPVGTAPSSSCASLFVSLSLRRSRLGSRAVCNRQRRDDRRDRVDRVVVSPRSQSHRVAITTAPGSTTTRDRSRAFRHAT